MPGIPATPASPGKALRLRPLLSREGATLYVNLEEAALLLGRDPGRAAEAALALRDRGAARVLVTNGAAEAAMASGDELLLATPPPVLVARATGAGDTFMAAHIAAEMRGETGANAFATALRAAAAHVSGDIAS